MCLPCLPLLFLHTVSNQKLQTWEPDYTYMVQRPGNKAIYIHKCRFAPVVRIANSLLSYSTVQVTCVGIIDTIHVFGKWGLHNWKLTGEWELREFTATKLHEKRWSLKHKKFPLTAEIAIQTKPLFSVVICTRLSSLEARLCLIRVTTYVTAKLYHSHGRTINEPY